MVEMNGKDFIDYAKLTFDRAYEDMNFVNGKWINPRITPLYKQLKFKGVCGEEIVNAFIHPDDIDVERYEDLKHGSWDF